MLVRLTYGCFNYVNVVRYWHMVVLMFAKPCTPPLSPLLGNNDSQCPLPLDPLHLDLEPPLLDACYRLVCPLLLATPPLGACYRLLRPPPLGSPPLGKDDSSLPPLSEKKMIKLDFELLTGVSDCSNSAINMTMYRSSLPAVGINKLYSSIDLLFSSIFFLKIFYLLS